MELVGREAHQIDGQRGNVDVHLAHGLRAIGVEAHAMLRAERCDLLDGLNDAGFVVAPHHRDQRDFPRTMLKQIRKRSDIDDAFGIIRQEDAFVAFFSQTLGSLANRAVFDAGGDEHAPIAFSPIERTQRTEDGQVRCFRASGGEDQVLVLTANQLRDRLPREVELAANNLAHAMNARWIGPAFGERFGDRRHDFRGRAGGRVVVEVNHGSIGDLAIESYTAHDPAFYSILP